MPNKIPCTSGSPALFTWALTNALAATPWPTPRGAAAPDGALLYVVKGRIDEWSPDLAESYAARGFVHYHELVSVADGALHPTLVVWLRHVAVTSFTLDGGPAPQLAHAVTPGADLDFINNWFVPYDPNGVHE